MLNPGASWYGIQHRLVWDQRSIRDVITFIVFCHRLHSAATHCENGHCARIYRSSSYAPAASRPRRCCWSRLSSSWACRSAASVSAAAARRAAVAAMRAAGAPSGCRRMRCQQSTTSHSTWRSNRRRRWGSSRSLWRSHRHLRRSATRFLYHNRGQATCPSPALLITAVFAGGRQSGRWHRRSDSLAVHRASRGAHQHHQRRVWLQDRRPFLGRTAERHC